MLTSSAFADEINPHPEKQIAVLKQCGVRHIEFRSILKTNVLALSDLQIQEFKSLLQKSGFKLSAIGSPIGKIKINEPFGPHLDKFKRAIELCKVFDTPNIRIFSYYPPDGMEWDDCGDYRREVLEIKNRVEGLIYNNERVYEEFRRMLGEGDAKSVQAFMTCIGMNDSAGAFVPAGIGDHALQLTADARQLNQLTNLIRGQYSAYALFAWRSVGAQPGRLNPRYLTEWKRLPDGILIATNKFDASFMNASNEYVRSFRYAPFPFPTAASPHRPMPYIAFNSQGQLVPPPDAEPRDELIPLARGSVFIPDLASRPDVVISPANNYTNNYIRINWLTGRASIDELTRPKF